jgi:hypothetical protein
MWCGSCFGQNVEKGRKEQNTRWSLACPVVQLCVYPSPAHAMFICLPKSKHVVPACASYDFSSACWSVFRLLTVPRLCNHCSNHLSGPHHTVCLKPEYIHIVCFLGCRGKPSISELYKERRRAYNRKSKKIEPDIWDRIEWKPPRWQKNPYVWVAFTLWLTLIAVSMAFGD